MSLLIVREAIDKAASYLVRAGITAGRLEAELLLGKILGLERIRLYVDYDRPLTGGELEGFRSLLLARARERVPVAYLIGEKSFFGLSFAVPRGVFIPRPETEELVEAAIGRIESMARKSGESDGRPLAFLDLCTGSGAIALTLAKKFPSAEVTATDLSPEAVHTAGENAERHGLGNRVRVREGDLFAAVEEGAVFDLIISNPPYIPKSALEELPPEIKRHEPLAALDGGIDGLAVLRRIITGAPGHLRPGGALALEHGHDQAGALAALASAAGLVGIEDRMDLAGRPRILLAEKPGTGQAALG